MIPSQHNIQLFRNFPSIFTRIIAFMKYCISHLSYPCKDATHWSPAAAGVAYSKLVPANAYLWCEMSTDKQRKQRVTAKINSGL